MTNKEIIEGLIDIKNWHCDGNPERYNLISCAIESLENQKEGRWKKISPAGIYECTCCGQDVMTSDIECYKFCHGCGARMEG